MNALLLEIKKALTPQVFDAGYEPVQISECDRQAINDVLGTRSMSSCPNEGRNRR
jgi:hypothetical protein